MDQESLGRALYSSSLKGHLRIVNALLSANAPVNYSPKSSTPLHQSSHRGYINITKALIAARADVNAQDCDNHTPLEKVT